MSDDRAKRGIARVGNPEGFNNGVLFVGDTAISRDTTNAFLAGRINATHEEVCDAAPMRKQRDECYAEIADLRAKLASYEEMDRLRQEAYRSLECPLCGAPSCAHRERWDFAALHEIAIRRRERIEELEAQLQNQKGTR